MNYMAWKPSKEDLDIDGEGEIDAPGLELKRGGIIAGLFFVGLLGMAALIPLDAGAYGEGVVAVSGSRQAVQHREGGIVTSLHVVEGQTVTKGQELLRVSASEAVATERGLTGEVLGLLAQQSRLLAERDRLGQVPEPIEFQNLSPQDRVLADSALQGQRLLFDARRNSASTERGILSQRIAQYNEQIGGVRSQISSNRRQQDLTIQELDGLKSLTERGFVSINRIRAIERSAAQLDGDYGSYRSDIARSSQAVGEARMQILAVDRRLAEDTATQLRDTQVKLAELQPRLVATRDQLARSVVRAPSAGRVVGLKVFTVGGVLAPGDMLMEVVPQNRALVIDAKVPPTDADDLYPGMETQVRFPALQERNMPILMGKISKVSADGFEDERTGVRYFRIEVIVPPAELEKISKIRGDTGLKAGLPAQVLVPLRKRTALSYLVEPLMQTFWRAGREH